MQRKIVERAADSWSQQSLNAVQL